MRSLKKANLPVCRYVVTDSDGNVALMGRAPLNPQGTFEIGLAGRLPSGAYTVLIALYLGGNAMQPDVRRFAIQSANGGIVRMETMPWQD